MEKVLFENCVCRIVEFNGKCFVDEVIDGEIVNGSVGMDREDVQEYLNDAGFNIQFNQLKRYYYTSSFLCLKLVHFGALYECLFT